MLENDAECHTKRISGEVAMPDSPKSAAECYASVVADAAIYHARRSSHNVMLEQWRDRVIAEIQAECDAEELRRISHRRDLIDGLKWLGGLIFIFVAHMAMIWTIS